MIKKTLHVQYSYDGLGGGREVHRYTTEEEVPNPTPEELNKQRMIQQEENTPEFKSLNQLIEELGDRGVDVSYFPKDAQEYLREYAKTITLKCNQNLEQETK